ncbi:MAG: Stk1 family PASTA domain-containing Ser/Thr kinase [Eubacterium sp.]|nr:Stk1 family PASTA domain-containing Ser/Thr kinase [Eubacterium sp.]
MLKEGIVLGERYEIISRVGSGGMADVYKARDHKLSRLVAVKVMKAEFREDTSFVTKFQKEAQAAARLSHPNVVNVFDVGEDRGLYYIVMELVEGITLKNYITKKGRLSVKEATSIAIQVSLGLQAAHHQGIVHRDVKPQNIIISTDGKVKLSDFGIAKASNSNTITANVMGSVHYSSPEQVRGGMSDARSDIYSLGVTMYEMATGRVPFDGDTTVSIAIKHLQEEMVPPSRYAPDLPYSLEQIILKATQKNQNRRYQNVGELIDDLKRSLLEPQGDFVTVAPLATDTSQTIKVSDQELKEIRSGINKKQEPKPKEKPRKFDDEDYDEDDDRGSGLERGLTIGGFIIGAIIIVILIIVIGNMAGIFHFGGRNSTAAASSASSVSSSTAESSSADEIEETPEPAVEEQVEVPDFRGMTVEAATQEAVTRKIGIKQVGTDASDEYAEGTIISQNVDPQSRVSLNTTIEVVVSSGKANVTIPTGLAGKPQADAQKELEDLGLTTSVELQSDGSVEVGSVISTDPAEGSSVPANSTVKLYISRGENTVTVPSLIGYDEATATQSLTHLGLEYVLEEGYSDAMGYGEVYEMDPVSGTEVPVGTSVTLYINSEEPEEEEEEGSGEYRLAGTLSEPEGYEGGEVRLELVQNGETTTIYEGENPWTDGDYSEPVYSESGETGVINIYEDGVRKWQYNNVPFEAV